MTLFPYTTLFRSLYCPAIAPTANHQGVDSTHRAAPVALRWSCTGKPPAVEAADGAGSGSKAGLQLWAVWIYWQRSEERRVGKDVRMLLGTGEHIVQRKKIYNEKLV